MLISAHIDFGRHRRRNIPYGLPGDSLSFWKHTVLYKHRSTSRSSEAAQMVLHIINETRPRKHDNVALLVHLYAASQPFIDPILSVA